MPCSTFFCITALLGGILPPELKKSEKRVEHIRQILHANGKYPCHLRYDHQNCLHLLKQIQEKRWNDSTFFSVFIKTGGTGSVYAGKVYAVIMYPAGTAAS